MYDDAFDRRPVLLPSVAATLHNILAPYHVIRVVFACFAQQFATLPAYYLALRVILRHPDVRRYAFMFRVCPFLVRHPSFNPPDGRESKVYHRFGPGPNS